MTEKEPLQHYREKRDFGRSPEPSGDDPPREKLKNAFVVQKHAARRLHYDFRLEAGGVLKSWAVPKGPSTNPDERRLAVQTEDHPLAYAAFEGRIPEGEYGAGAVIVWDAGYYRNLTRDRRGREITVEQGIAKGHLVLQLSGRKLRGGYSLVRTGGRDSPPPGPGSNWLLIKKQDAEAAVDRSLVDESLDSVLTGRSVEQVANEEEPAPK